MSKVLVVTKPDGSTHTVALHLKSAYQAKNRFLKPHQQFKLEEMSQEEADKLPFKVAFVNESAKSIISEKDAEIAKLKEKLEALNKGGQSEKAIEGEAGTAGDIEKSIQVNANVAIKAIEAMTAAGDVTAYCDGESRATVLAAAEKQIEKIKA